MFQEMYLCTLVRTYVVNYEHVCGIAKYAKNYIVVQNNEATQVKQVQALLFFVHRCGYDSIFACSGNQAVLLVEKT